MNRGDWLDEALDTLYEEGVERVKVEVLAKRLGVTKGSFYWHFKDRSELLEGVIQRWQDRQLAILRDFVDTELVDAKDSLHRLINFTYKKDSRHDIGMRAWALTHKGAARAVRKVDRSRIGYVESVFRRMGFSENEIKLRARMMYFFQVGEYTGSIRDKKALRDLLAERRFELLSRPRQ